MHAPRDPAIDVLPRTPQRTTALNATGGNNAQADATLETDRSTLYKKVKEYGIA